MIYCVYLTIYKGNKLPPFYIGYSTIENISKGYHGSVSSIEYKDLWRKEQKESPQLFNTIIISSHLTKTDALNKERKLLKTLSVIKNPLYINKNIFPQYDWTGRKSPHISERNRLRKGPLHPNFGKPSKLRGRVHSEEAKKKMKKKAKGRFKNYSWINNGIIRKRVKHLTNMPLGFIIGYSL